jgi:hypothetical protein
MARTPTDDHVVRTNSADIRDLREQVVRLRHDVDHRFELGQE